MIRRAPVLLALALVGGAAGAAATHGHAGSANRAIVERFVDRFYVRKDIAGAFAAFVVPDYIQHNPGLADGSKAAVEALAPMFGRVGAQFDVRHVMVDRNLALVHLLGRGDPATPGAAVVDLYRLDHGKVVEHWDVIQPIEPGTDPLGPVEKRPARPQDTARNRVIARDFADLGLRRKQFAAAFTRYAAPGMIQHNERLGTGRDGSIAALTALFADPGSSVEVRHILVDGDMIAIHYRGKLSATNPGAAVVELFRVDHGKFVEHWGAFQPMPTSARNSHPMF